MSELNAIPVENAQQAALFLRGLANEHRLQILCRLAGGEKNVGELLENTTLSPSSFSQHLAVLRQQDLIQFRKQAQTLFYSIKDPDVLVFIQQLKNKFCPDL